MNQLGRIGGPWYHPQMPKGEKSKPKTYPLDLVENVKGLYGQGCTQLEISKSLGLSPKVIWKLMMNHGIVARIAAKRDQRGPKNHMWKGTEAGYTALHYRVQSLRGKPQLCERCGANGPGRSYDWANLTGKLDDPKDFERMCRSCHWKYDLKILNIAKMKERYRKS